MEIDNIRHKALRRLVETGNAKGLPGDVDRIRNLIAYLVAITTVDEIMLPPNFGAHQLKGDRAGTWALTITRNWRMTFEITGDLMIAELDLEDYR